jgi:hypothetical protein
VVCDRHFPLRLRHEELERPSYSQDARGIEIAPEVPERKIASLFMASIENC